MSSHAKKPSLATDQVVCHNLSQRKGTGWRKDASQTGWKLYQSSVCQTPDAHGVGISGHLFWARVQRAAIVVGENNGRTKGDVVERRRIRYFDRFHRCLWWDLQLCSLSSQKISHKGSRGKLLFNKKFRSVWIRHQTRDENRFSAPSLQNTFRTNSVLCDVFSVENCHAWQWYGHCTAAGKSKWNHRQFAALAMKLDVVVRTLTWLIEFI